MSAERQAAAIARELRKCEPRAPALRAVRVSFSRKLRDETPERIIEIALSLLGRRCPGRRFVAYELILEHPDGLATLDLAALEQLGSGMASWGDTDTFGDLAGRAWRIGRIRDRDVHRWAASEDRWWRRLALVCTVALNVRARGGEGDAARTLAVCRKLLGDRDDMVVKAMSWALRALAVRDPDAVRDFLDHHETELAARAIREVRNKLGTGLKNPRRTTEPRA